MNTNAFVVYSNNHKELMVMFIFNVGKSEADIHNKFYNAVRYNVENSYRRISEEAQQKICNEFKIIQTMYTDESSNYNEPVAHLENSVKFAVSNGLCKLLTGVPIENIQDWKNNFKK